MITIGHEYEVRDGNERLLGSVCLQQVYRGTVSGRLVPEPAFETVRGLFERHEALMSAKGSTDDSEVMESSRQIASLRVSLKNGLTGERVSAGLVFVSAQLLFSCDAEFRDES
ncbi:MAG: hypothetical protein P4L83_01295 [Nevskia sp.]|nr:hypothetical protein [Nevskia sp.]